MAIDRIVSPTVQENSRFGGEERNWSLRPKFLREYVGQTELIERLQIAIQASLSRKEPLEHVLLYGPPGLGKTTLAYVMAKEMEANVHVTSGPALTRPTDLVEALTRLQSNDVLFIDEIHRLPVAVEEFIYPAMEDFRIDVRVESGLHARTLQLKVKPFSLIGATTRAGLVSSPLRSRFGITHHLRYYDNDELVTILDRSARLLSIEAPQIALRQIALRSRGTPRVANRLLRRVRDFSLVRADGLLDESIVAQALEIEGVDHCGLDELDRSYLRVIAETFNGGPAGLEAIAATMNEDSGTLEDVIEPYLLQVGFVARTRRGRILTASGAKHIGRSDLAALTDNANTLYD